MTDEELAEMMYLEWSESPSTEMTWDDLDGEEQDRWIRVAEMVREPIINNVKINFTEDMLEMEDIIDDYRDAFWAILEILKPIINLKVVK